MIKLVVSDMDGTLINHASRISVKNQKAIQSLLDHNIEFAIASGRDYEGVYSVMSEYDIICDAILGNGAQYCDRDGNILMDCYMDKSIVKDVVDIFEKKGLHYMLFTTKGYYTGQNPKEVRDAFVLRANKRFLTPMEDYDIGGRHEKVFVNFLKKIDDFDEFLSRDLEVIKVESFSLSSKEISIVKEMIKDIPTISYLSSFDDNIEVTHQYAQKGLILEKVIKIKGLKKEEVAVLGDGMNDMTLFECFPYSFAPSNAEELIKQKAYAIVRDCEEDGFAQAVETILKL